MQNRFSFPSLRYVLLATVVLASWQCRSSKPVTTTTPKSPTSAPEMATADFVAGGFEPTWALEIDFDKAMRLTTTTAPKIMYTPVPEPVIPQDVAATSYRAETEAGYLHVTIFDQKCVDASGQTLPNKVWVTRQTNDMKEVENYEGCGRYNSQSDDRLHDIWALESIDDLEIEASEFPGGVPYIELHVADQRLLGSGSCNEIRGTFTKRTDQLSFGPIISTKKACPTLATEAKMVGALSGNSFAYKIANLRLTLNNDAHTLVFRKVD